MKTIMIKLGDLHIYIESFIIKGSKDYEVLYNQENCDFVAFNDSIGDLWIIRKDNPDYKKINKLYNSGLI